MVEATRLARHLSTLAQDYPGGLTLSLQKRRNRFGHGSGYYRVVSVAVVVGRSDGTVTIHRNPDYLNLISQ